jgi:carbonic anhydrase/acetyltransferase-like protein (isoleucine patch superfamily)
MSSKLTLVNNEVPDLENILKEHRIKIGKDVVFEGDCYFGDAVTVGDDVIFFRDNKIGGHTVIEMGARIGSHCEIGEGSYIGEGVIIGDNVSLPKRTYVGADRRVVDRSEEFTAVFSSAGKVESFFGSDRILMYDPEVGQDYETSISFKEFITKAKVRQRLRIKQEEKRGEFLKNVSSLISVLKNIKKG